MNLLSSFNDFYENLSGDSLFFFWIVVFLFFFIIFLFIVLVIKNRKLAKLLKEEQATITTSEEEAIPVMEIKEKVSELKEEPLSAEIKEEIKEEKAKKIIAKPSVEEVELYKKNVFREMNARQTSPIHIDNHNEEDKSDLYDIKDEDFYDINSPYLREGSVSPLEEMEDAYEVNDKMKFAHDIVDKMEEEIKPSNIELTDYEKKQEEEAIISYDELLKVKDKIYNITEEEENEEFIDELKSFRIDLK